MSNPSLRLRLAGGARSLLILALDGVAISAALYLGYLIRFEGEIAPPFRGQYGQYLPLLLAIRLPLHFAFRIHRWSYRLSGIYEAMRVIATCATGTAAFVTVCYFLERGGPPRSVVAIEFLLTTSLLGLLRFSPRLTHDWVLLNRRRSRGQRRLRALIVGAGSSGDILARELKSSDRHSYEVLGFVDDAPSRWRTSIAGIPVLGPIASLREIAERREIDTLFFADPDLPAERLRQIIAECAALKLAYKILPAAAGYTQADQASELRELTPENLLNRAPVTFDSERMRRLIAGRRILVTGAAGTIGSEICRQVAAHGPAQLVMLDIHENELYLLFRALQQQNPELSLVVEIGDVRDEGRIRRLFEEHRCQDVFHAAAHKHVPLMETAPEQAVLNNVSGCRIVARAAAEAGAERFVLVSTDKAVEPTSVMGATKRIAELVVADLAHSSSTRFTAVRFGNVLGSAGSVVPLFREQIAAGGPVTVTDPECRRYIMTPGEAVGLVLLAGLSDLGDLCVLEMGEPIRILDLARLMITISGRVPDRDVEIAFTGLRPGERLEERLMSEREAARSRATGDRIHTIAVDPPAAATLQALRDLERIARTGDRHAVIEAMQRVLPEYTPSALWSARHTARASLVAGS